MKTESRKGSLTSSTLSSPGKDFFMIQVPVNPLRPNNDVSQTSHCNIKGVSVSEVMRIENMITQVQCY